MSNHQVIVRNLRFPHDQVPRDWMPARPAVARFFDQLSLLFPRGERFFIESVRPFEARLSAALREQVRAFVQQEALHSREHQHYNDRLAQLGYPVAEIVANNDQWLDGMTKWPLTRQLAFTCAIEHFTAIIAHFALENDDMFGDAHPVMAALWRWHAAEENEHAAVAFDVFHEVGGSYFERVAVMLYATVEFWSKVALRQPKMMKVDGSHRSPRAYWDLMVFLLGRPGIVRRGLRPYLAYFRRDFHPSDLNSDQLVARWREVFESSPVYRDPRHPKAPSSPTTQPVRALRQAV